MKRGNRPNPALNPDAYRRRLALRYTPTPTLKLLKLIHHIEWYKRHNGFSKSCVNFSY